MSRYNRILVLGFSVLTGQTYKKLMAFDGVSYNLRVIGLGGHHYNFLTPLMDYILDDVKPDFVWLDLVSTPCRRWATEQGFCGHLDAILGKIGAIGAGVGFINFFRADVDPDNDLLFGIVQHYAAQYKIPLLDLARRVTTEFDDYRMIFSDEVHFSESGAIWAAPQVDAAIRTHLDTRPDLSDIQIKPAYLRHGAMRAVDLVETEDAIWFESYGFALPAVIVPEGQKQEIVVPDGYRVTGIYMERGPRSGIIEIAADGFEPISLINYDRRSYYSRMQHIAIPFKTRRVEIRQLAGLPDIGLVKGVPDRRRRIGALTLVMVERSAVA